MPTINLKHKEMTCRESYEAVKKLYADYPTICLSPAEWKKLHLARHEFCMLRFRGGRRK